MESNSVCFRKSDNKIGWPRSGSLISLSRVWLQTELDDTKSYYQLIIQITISEKRGIVKLWKKGKIALEDWKRRRKLLVIETKVVIGWIKLQLWIWLTYWTVRQQIVRSQLGKWISEKQEFFKPMISSTMLKNSNLFLDINFQCLCLLGLTAKLNCNIFAISPLIRVLREGGGGGVVVFPSRVPNSLLSGACVACLLSLREQDTLTSLVVLPSTDDK